MKDNKDAAKPSLKERLCKTLDIQPDVFPRETLVEIRGRNSVTVKGGGAIRVYTDTQIKLAVRGGSLCVMGERLCCSAYSRGSVTVEGRIASVSFEEVSE